jgi:hypothetical protein
MYSVKGSFNKLICYSVQLVLLTNKYSEYKFFKTVLGG